jgi:hypothetical protein
MKKKTKIKKEERKRKRMFGFSDLDERTREIMRRTGWLTKSGFGKNSRKD